MPSMLIPIGRLPFPHLFQPWTEALPGQEPRYSAVLIVDANGQKSGEYAALSRTLFDAKCNMIGIDLARDELVDEGVHQKTRKWSTLKTYGGKLAEHATQATAHG